MNHLTELSRRARTALTLPEAEDAREHLQDRGLDDSTEIHFQLGYSPEYHGIVIPYRTVTGKVVMLKIRRLGDGKPKYLTSEHDFPLDQRAHLFHTEALMYEPLVLTEGEFDTMALWQIGINAAAVPGVDGWNEHWGLLIPKGTVLLMDPDDAGVKGAHKIRKALSQYGRSVRIAKLPDDRDVNELVRDGDDRLISEAIAGAN